MKGMNPIPTPSQPIDSTKKPSIFQLLNGGEQIPFEYGIGIIDSKIENKFRVSELRHYFSYRLPSKNNPSVYENPYIYRIILAKPTLNDIKTINNVFAGKFKTEKVRVTELTNKYESILSAEQVVQGSVIEPGTIINTQVVQGTEV